MARFIGRSNVLTLPVVAADRAERHRGAARRRRDHRAAPPTEHGLRQGDTALVSVRPEHIGLTSATEAGALPGRVTEVEFTGMATNLVVDVAGEPRAGRRDRRAGRDRRRRPGRPAAEPGADVGGAPVTPPATPSPATVAPITGEPTPPRGPRRRLAERFAGGTGSRWFPYVLVFPLALILWGYVVQPMFATFAESVGVDGVENYGSFVTGAGVARSSLVTSLIISAASVLLCGVVGVAMAFLLKRFSFPGRRLIEAIILVPAALPPLIGAISFQLLYSETGILPRGLQQLFGAENPVLPFSGIAGRARRAHVHHVPVLLPGRLRRAGRTWTRRSRRRRTTWAPAGSGCGARCCCRCSPRRWSPPRCWSS